MTILVDFGNHKGTFGDPKKGHNPQFEKRCIKQCLLHISIEKDYQVEIMLVILPWEETFFAEVKVIADPALKPVQVNNFCEIKNIANHATWTYGVVDGGERQREGEGEE